MHNARFIIRENMPCWYELSWQKNPARISFSLHNDFIQQIGPVNYAFLAIDKTFELDKFHSDFENDFGFHQNLKLESIDSEFHKYSIALPTWKPGGKCQHCKGTGKYFGGKCSFCNGKKIVFNLDFQSAFNVCATFHVLFSITAYSQIQTSASKCQLFMTTTAMINRMSGFDLTCMASVALVKWLRKIGTKKLPSITDAMKIAYETMVKPPRKSFMEIGAYCDEGNLHLSCPGNACGLDANSIYDEESEGYEMLPHNVESPFQQLVFISGLAALHDLARKNM